MTARASRRTPPSAVGFVAAVGRFYAKYAHFFGWAGRSGYWWVALYLVPAAAVIQVLATIGASPAGASSLLDVSTMLPSFAFSLGTIVSSGRAARGRVQDLTGSAVFTTTSG